MKRQLPLFLIIGGVGFVIDAGGVFLLVTLLGVEPLLGRVPGFCLAIVTTFLLHRFLTFKTDNLVPLFSAFVRYLAANAVSQGLNFGVYTVLVMHIAFFAALPIGAVFVGSAVAAILSFILFKTIVFKTHD